MKRKKKSKPPRRTWPEGFRPVERVRGRKGYNRAKAKRETITEEQADSDGLRWWGGKHPPLTDFELKLVTLEQDHGLK